MQNTSQFKTQCKGDISHALETNRCVLSHGMQNSRCALTKRAAVLNICSTWWYLATI